MDIQSVFIQKWRRSSELQNTENDVIDYFLKSPQDGTQLVLCIGEKLVYSNSSLKTLALNSLLEIKG